MTSWCLQDPKFFEQHSDATRKAHVSLKNVLSLLLSCRSAFFDSCVPISLTKAAQHAILPRLFMPFFDNSVVQDLSGRLSRLNRSLGSSPINVPEAIVSCLRAYFEKVIL
jgi:hypothetical protein